MTELTPLKAALLELGLEDWIPLPETVGAMRFEGVPVEDGLIESISGALVDLLRDDRIQVWSGPWADAEPSLVSPVVAESLLRDHRRYSFASEADGLERVFYVNVDNFRA